MIIAVDFDETLFPTLERVIETYNKRNDATFDLSQITTYNLYECLDASVADKFLDLFLEKEVYDNLQPYKGAVRTIKNLVDQGHEIYIATATNVKNLEWKEQLLQRYFPFIPKNNLIRIHNKKLINVDVFIEDSLDNLTQTFAERICLDQPWNQDEDKDYVYSIYRVHHWGEVINIINDIERKSTKWDR